MRLRTLTPLGDLWIIFSSLWVTYLVGIGFVYNMKTPLLSSCVVLECKISFLVGSILYCQWLFNSWVWLGFDFDFFLRRGELRSFCSTILSEVKGLLLVWILAVSLLSMSWPLFPWYMVYRCNSLCMLPGWWRHQRAPVHSPGDVPVLSLDDRSSDWCPLTGHVAAVIAHALLGQCGQRLKPLLGLLRVAAHTCLWSPRQHGSSHVPQEQVLFGRRRAHSENAATLLPLLSLRPPLQQGASPLWWAQASSQYTLGCHTLASSISHSQPQSSPWVWPPKPKLQHPVPDHTSGWGPGWGAHGGGRGHLCRPPSILPTTIRCCALLQGSEAPPLQADLSVQEGTS